MDTLSVKDNARGSGARLLLGFFCLGWAVVLLAGGSSAAAQARESATAGRTFLWVGGGASGYYLQYGAVKNLGVTGYVDADSIRRFGIEGEGRWLEFHQTNQIHAETYLAGPRYHFNMGRFQPYVKGLGGLGKFNFTNSYAHGTYFVVAGGGGVDYRLSPRWSARGDFEYQYWPQFTFGAMSSGGVTVGLRYLLLR
jgi:hypothetical protein